ncbi:MAG: O-antigen ligase family protein [Candidatus Saccharimonadales bacterium]
MQFARRIPYWGFIALLVYMPFHVFLSQSLSLVSGGLEVWKVGKDVLLAALVVFTICLVFMQRRSGKVFTVLLCLALLYGGLHILLWLVNPEIYRESALLSVVYNNRLPALALLGYGAVILNPGKFVFSSLIKIVLLVSTTIACLGILQHFLPPDFLTHLGYSLERGAHAAFFIDNNPALPRIMSTLREPNSLGAYLVLPIAAITALLATKRNILTRPVMAGILSLHLLAIFLTHSRSAWLAGLLAVGVVLFCVHRKRAADMAKRFWPLLLLGALSAVLIVFSLRSTSIFETYIVHTDDPQFNEQSSTDYHYQYIEDATRDVLSQPLGHGPGTAGPTSLHNPEGGKITENYYLQIAYEVGVAGLLVFVAIATFVYLTLVKRKDVFGIILIASFWGYVVANMFLHTWGNEAVATQWWLLAGAAMGMKTLNARGDDKP